MLVNAQVMKLNGATIAKMNKCAVMVIIYNFLFKHKFYSIILISYQQLNNYIFFEVLQELLVVMLMESLDRQSKYPIQIQ